MDNHTHLPIDEAEIPAADGYKMPLERQLELAREVGVSRIITVGCERPDWEPTLELARTHQHISAALAIHPNEAALHAGHLERSPDGWEHEQREHHIPLIDALAELSHLLDDPQVVAVGETGLDYFRTAEPGREAQRESFAAHLEMARAKGLPTQIHDRDAHADTIRLVQGVAFHDQTIVFHSFSGDREMATVLRGNGWYASFSGMMTYPANVHLREALVEMPRSRVLVETDAPYLTAVPHRGQPNASYSMPWTVRAIAELWEEDVEETCRILMRNSERVYGAW